MTSLLPHGDCPPAPYGYIYIIQNKLNSKVYIGQTIQDPALRWSKHKSDTRHEGIKSKYTSRLHNAMRKYGVTNFSFTVVDTAFSKEHLDGLEVLYIRLYRSLNKEIGYNLKSGGANGKHSPETIVKLRKASTGVVWSEETRRKQSASQKKKWTFETRKELSNKVSGKNNPFFGKKHTQETIEKGRTANLGKQYTEQRLLHCAKLMNERWKDPDYAARMAASRKQMWQDPVWKAKTLENRRLIKLKKSLLVEG